MRAGLGFAPGRLEETDLSETFGLAWPGLFPRPSVHGGHLHDSSLARSRLEGFLPPILSSTRPASSSAARYPIPSQPPDPPQIINRHINPCSSKSAQTCFVLPITSPLTLLQSILLSSSSSTKPQTTTLSPRTRYKPCGCSTLGSSSPCSRITRSTVSESTRLVTWSQETRVPVRVRPSTVRRRTFSGGGEGVSVEVLGREAGEGRTVYVGVERHCCGARGCLEGREASADAPGLVVGVWRRLFFFLLLGCERIWCDWDIVG